MNQVGTITKQIATLVGMPEIAESAIMLGKSNVAHMVSKHPGDYKKYGNKIGEIVSEPDYVGKNPKDESIEYVKEFVIDGEYVKVAVRVSSSGVFSQGRCMC